MTFTLAIVGRPNVGKSTLFNRLVGKRLAIVDDTPGVTRDRREGEGVLAELEFRLFDTAGLEDAAPGSLEARMRAQTENAVDDADVVLFMIDGRVGVTPTDELFGRWLRTRKTPVILGVNKCEGSQGESGRLDAYRLGLGEPIGISAEHGEGLGDLYDAWNPTIKRAWIGSRLRTSTMRMTFSSTPVKRRMTRSSPHVRCSLPSSVARTRANRRWSTACSARTGC